MKRWIRRILICLLLGAVINVAVAWACSWWVPIYVWDLQARGSTSAESANWYLDDYATLGRRFISGQPETTTKTELHGFEWGPFLTSDEIDALPREFLPQGHPRADNLTQRLYIAAGFPCLALSGFADVRPGGSLTTHDSFTSWTHRSSLMLGAGRADTEYWALPLRPLRVGMIVNTLTYAFVGFLAIALVGLVRRRACGTLGRSLAACAVIGLVLGNITTFLVVWWCAYFVNVEGDYGRTDGSGRTLYEDSATGESWVHLTFLEVEPGAKRIISNAWPWRFGGSDPRGAAAELLPAWADFLKPEAGVRIKREADARGWPVVAMWTAIEYPLEADTFGTFSDDPVVHHGIMLPRYDEGALRFEWCRLLPLAPIWPGFVIDTLFYNAAWSALLFVCLGPRPVCRAIRRKRGRCPDCGYDLHGALAAGCPECGWGREVGAES